MSSYDLSVVIPCLNEEKTIGICIEKILKAFEQYEINGEIILSDNDSSDNSIEIAKEFNSEKIKIVKCTQKGYGNALRHGFSFAEGEYILMGDADNTYDFSDLNKFYEKATQNKNIAMVIGSRFKGEIEKGAMPFLHKYLGNPVLTFIINLLFGTNISDSQCGMRLFKKAAYENIEFSATGMEFATELIIKFAYHNLKIVETPIKLNKNSDGRTPHLNTFRDGFRILFFILKKRFLDKGK